jgi:hypothetical protein
MPVVMYRQCGILRLPMICLKRTPAENGVPKHLMALSLRQASPQTGQANTPVKK